MGEGRGGKGSVAQIVAACRTSNGYITRHMCSFAVRPASAKETSRRQPLQGRSRAAIGSAHCCGLCVSLEEFRMNKLRKD